MEGWVVKCLVVGVHDSRGRAGVTNGPVSLRCRSFGSLNVLSLGVFSGLVAVAVCRLLREYLSSRLGY